LSAASPEREYRDFGNLVNLSEYATVGNLIGFVGKRSVYLEGVFARLMYRSLYKMHQRALHGPLKTARYGCKADFAAHRAARLAALKI
jgi:NADH:ubiquinone reductase (H+-translocating)